jgi:peptidoglycan/xylan/chitin deacetylase (PgdA/CDA1 family)
MKDLEMHYLTLSWDDGFRKSSLVTAEIFEKYGLRAEFNIIATASLPENALPADMKPAARWGADYGDFDLWNELQARGHVIQPHGFMHANKSTLPFLKARELILKCLDIFNTRLVGFVPEQTIFAFPYNMSTPELEAWLPSVVRAYRTGPGPAINDFPSSRTVKLTTSGMEEAETGFDQYLHDLFEQPDGWLIYNVHGLDGEGWGPLRSEFLAQRIERLSTIAGLKILPAREVLALATG